MKQGERKMNKRESNRPAYVKRVGNVKVAVFLNGGGEGKTYHNVSVSRTYRDGDTFKESSTLNGLADVACLKEALGHVTDWISRYEDDANSGDE
jgi:hypothetical protein